MAYICVPRAKKVCGCEYTFDVNWCTFNYKQVNFKNNIGSIFNNELYGLLRDLDVLHYTNWPDNVGIQQGKDCVKILASRFHSDETKILRFREFKDTKDFSKINYMHPL